ncbi:winged helix-turn-helix transcriptional regulator [Mycolicibacterium flavescens]|uniref:winged helix-turn-helix transcriptional regulator n=1 Tax=Mycolicibacterium flavescens TaxID=1776 RepID=UPI001F1F43F4|nr:response regulator transcription factor [Mycolicibacterium flavescens]
MLLVEPRRIYATTVARHLLAGDFAVEVAYSPGAALTGLRERDPDVVVVGVGAQGLNNAMLDRIRHEARVGVVALSDGDVTPLLLTGGVVSGDDIEALNARIRLALRHCRGDGGSRGGGYGDKAHRREIGDLRIDVAARRVFLRGEPLPLTRTEFEILCTLAESPGEPVTCRHLQLSLWGYASAGGRSTLGVHLGNLRRKLGDDPHSPRYLRTVRGTGYCLTADVAQAVPGAS